MARVKDLPCNRCGKMMWSGTTSLPEGKARCQACRRIEPQPWGALNTGSPLVMCPWCWEIFDRGRMARRKFCSRACFAAFNGEQQRVRSLDDQHQRRCEREKSASGLSRAQRSRLLTQWQHQGKTCAYCDAPATTVDHIVSLVRGGTNHEGNLAPCCKRCNSSKAGLLIIEWRTGKRLPRMGRALAWQNKLRAAAKPKPPKQSHPCLICATDTTRRLYCSTDCGYEANNRRTRDKYRASVGLTVDFTESTKWWNVRKVEQVFE